MATQLSVKFYTGHDGETYASLSWQPDSQFRQVWVACRFGSPHRPAFVPACGAAEPEINWVEKVKD